MRVYFQIGTNTGNDLFRKKVIADKPDLVILVEAIPDLIPVINHHYKGIPNVYIFNYAIYYEDSKKVNLVIPAKKKVYGTTADNGVTYDHAHFSLMPMNDWGSKEDMIEIETNTVRFDTLCKVFNLKHIDYLQMDTEGFDTEIIKMINFEKIDIRKIRYEIWAFSPSEFTRYHSEKAAGLGTAGMEISVKLLKNAGYRLEEVTDEDGHDMIATKI
jgi:FkbM family methyltransferase